MTLILAALLTCPPPVDSRELTGIASWYGSHFAGRRTASGEPFDPESYTLACRQLPLGTIVIVSNPRNGRQVLARVNDRGPYYRGRRFDLSRRVAEELDLKRQGVGRVRVKVLYIPARRKP